MEILEMCRACLATGKDILPMVADLIKKYNVLTSLNVCSTNDMPLYICSACHEVVNFYSGFREKCISSDLIFKNIVYEDTKGIREDEKIEIELEPIVWDNCDEDATEPFTSPSVIKTVESDDWTPNKITRKPRKKKMAMKTEAQKQKITNGTKKIKANLVKPRKKKIPKPKTDKSLKSDYTIEHCGLCSKKFYDKETLVQHLENHRIKNNCERCSESCFIDYTHQLAHRFVHIPDDRKICHLCPKKCKSHDHYECHLVKVHKLRGENGKIICKLCSSSYNSVKHLKSHTMFVHSEIKYFCDECGKGFRMVAALRSHLLSHTDVKKIACEVCDYTCKSYGNMKEHNIRKHTVGRVYCKHCGRAFANQQLLDKHNINCKLMPCPVCGLFFYKVTRHLRTHTDECRYKCDRCPKQFRSRTSYMYHMNRHDGKKAFHCEYCPMKFYSQTVLIKHRRTHTGEKPYVCKICFKAFTGNHNLKVHMKVHGLHLVVKRTAPVDTNSFKKQ